MNERLMALGSMIACIISIASAEPPLSPQTLAERMFGPAANLVHDFGAVPHGTQLHHGFVVTNIYSVPLEITRITTPCLLAWADKRKLQPNEKTTIHVRWDARRFSGQKGVGMWVTFGAPLTATAHLSLKAFRREDLICDPGEIDFGYLERGHTPSTTFNITYTGSLAWQISGVVVPKNAPFEATVRELDRRPGQVGYQVVVSLKKDAAAGEFREDIIIETNDPITRLLPVLVHGNIE